MSAEGGTGIINFFTGTESKKKFHSIEIFEILQLFT
jgi:hypothetical protein